MNHPAKPAALEPLEPRDEPVWLALLAAADDRCRVNMRSREAAAVLLMQGVPMQPVDAEAAVDRIAATGRIERDPGGLRVCIERVVQPAQLYGSIARSELWTKADPAARAVWLELLSACDPDGCIARPFDELASNACVGRSAFDSALAWLTTDDRIERKPDGTLRLKRFGRYQSIHPRPQAAHTEDTTHGSTQKGTRETGGSE